MLVIPTKPVKSQTFLAVLAGQETQFNIYQKEQGLFMDVLLNGSIIVAGVVCENANPIIRKQYLGYQGDFMWWDTQGSSDPDYTGLGSRFALIYLAQSELPAGLY